MPPVTQKTSLWQIAVAAALANESFCVVALAYGDLAPSDHPCLPGPPASAEACRSACEGHT